MIFFIAFTILVLIFAYISIIRHQSKGKCSLYHRWYKYNPREISREMFKTIQNLNIISFREYKLISSQHLLYFRMAEYHRCHRCGHKKQTGMG